MKGEQEGDKRGFRRGQGSGDPRYILERNIESSTSRGRPGGRGDVPKARGGRAQKIHARKRIHARISIEGYIHGPEKSSKPESKLKMEEWEIK
jgi:hypothetical protein